MDTAFKVGYSFVVAILFVLVVILGQRTFYDEPDYPVLPPSSVSPPSKNIYCDFTEFCYKDGVLLTPEQEESLSAGDRAYLGEQRRFAQAQRDYDDERKDYFRNVFIVTTVLGIMAIGAAIYLYFRRIEALPLGLLLGGIGVVIYGWVESARGPDEAVGTAPLFITAAIGFVAVLAGGYWFLGSRRRSDSG